MQVLLAFAAYYCLHIHQMDVITAYLNRELQEEIFMELLEGLTFSKSCYTQSSVIPSSLLCQLCKFLYGLKQRGRTWNQKLFKFILSIDFTISKVDTNVYLQYASNNFIILAIYVDDCLLITNNNGLLPKTKQQLSLELEMTNLGSITKTTILELEIKYKQDIGYFTISQSKYINLLLSKFKMESCNFVTTPIESSIKLTKVDSPTTQEEIDKLKNFPYKTLMGSLLH